MPIVRGQAFLQLTEHRLERQQRQAAFDPLAADQTHAAGQHPLAQNCQRRRFASGQFFEQAAREEQVARRAMLQLGSHRQMWKRKFRRISLPRGVCTTSG